MEKQELVEQMTRAITVAKHNRMGGTGIPMPEGGVPRAWREDIACHFSHEGYRVRFDDAGSMILMERK